MSPRSNPRACTARSYWLRSSACRRAPLATPSRPARALAQAERPDGGPKEGPWRVASVLERDLGDECQQRTDARRHGVGLRCVVEVSTSPGFSEAVVQNLECDLEADQQRYQLGRERPFRNPGPRIFDRGRLDVDVVLAVVAFGRERRTGPVLAVLISLFSVFVIHVSADTSVYWPRTPRRTRESAAAPDLPSMRCRRFHNSSADVAVTHTAHAVVPRLRRSCWLYVKHEPRRQRSATTPRGQSLPMVRGVTARESLTLREDTGRGMFTSPERRKACCLQCSVSPPGRARRKRGSGKVWTPATRD